MYKLGFLGELAAMPYSLNGSETIPDPISSSQVSEKSQSRISPSCRPSWNSSSGHFLITLFFHHIKDESEDSPQPEYNWTGIIISALVITVILSLVVISTIMLTPSGEGHNATDITLAMFLSGELNPRLFNGTWVSSTEFVFRAEEGSINLYDVNKLGSSVLVASRIMKWHNPQEFLVSPDVTDILFISDIKQVTYRGKEAKYIVYNIDTDRTHPVSPPPHPHPHTGDKDKIQRLQYATWTRYSRKPFTPGKKINNFPDSNDIGAAPSSSSSNNNPHASASGSSSTASATGNGLIFVHANDVYFKPSSRHRAVERITTDGFPGVVYNGIPDLAFEENIFGGGSALWVSPEGKRLLFAKFNDSGLPEVLAPTYSSRTWAPKENEPQQQQHPLSQDIVGGRVFRMPKAGSSIPEVTLWVADLTRPLKKAQIYIQPPVGFGNKTDYPTAISWVDESKVSVVWTNRKRDVTILSLCEAKQSWRCKEVFRERNKAGGSSWIGGNPLFSIDGRYAIFLTAKPIWGERKLTIAEINYNSNAAGASSASNGQSAPAAGSSSEPKTEHPRDFDFDFFSFEPTELLGWNEKENFVLFMAKMNGSQRHLMSMSDYGAGPGQVLRVACVTCELALNETEASSPFYRHQCLAFRTWLSPSLTHYVLECAGPRIPWAWLFSAPDHEPVTALEANSDMSATIEDLTMPEFMNYRIEFSDGFTDKIPLILPHGVHPRYTFDAEIKYPIVVQMGATAGFNKDDTHEWIMHWGMSLASSKDMIYALIQVETDPPVEATPKETTLGRFNLKRQLEAVKILLNELPVVNQSMVLVWGWGEGAYLALQAMADLTDPPIRCGIAVAPITSWNHVNSFLAESYLGEYTPSSAALFNSSGLLHKGRKFGDGKYLHLVSGTQDSRFPMVHSMLFSKALTGADVMFSQRIYPDEGHGMTGVTQHLYESMEKFLRECLHPMSDPFEEQRDIRKSRVKMHKMGKSNGAGEQKPWNKFDHF